jgi:hypothetical protein
MKKYNVHTTISAKHRDILNKHLERCETQQKVLELALESLDNDPNLSHTLSLEEKQWMRLGKDLRGTLFVLQKNSAKLLFETASVEKFREYIEKDKPLEFTVEYFYKKPLKDCNILQIIDIVIYNFKIQNSSDSIYYADEDDHYVISVTHSMGLNYAKISVMMHESLFHSYGIRADCYYSERSINIKIYKNSS